MKCWVCNTELIWGGDHDLEQEPGWAEYFLEDLSDHLLHFQQKDIFLL